jgi:phosphoribosyl 1,2-cyclic phosphate phosphodiesterase
MRSSLYVQGAAGERAVIDTGPEFRLQAIRAGITRLDGLFLTHAHADHLHGLDDIRPLCQDKPLPVYADANTMREMRERFAYIFQKTQIGGGKPRITPVIAAEPIRLGHLIFTPLPVKHGTLDILGWKIQEGPASATYLTDTSDIPPGAFSLIGQPQAVIIGGLRERPHETHFSFLQALTAAARTKTSQIYLTHICHDHSHQSIEAFCRLWQKSSGFIGAAQPAYDELTISLL